MTTAVRTYSALAALCLGLTLLSGCASANGRRAVPPGTAQPEHGRPGPLRADTVQSERPQSEQVRPEQVQPEQSRSERVQQPPGIPIRPPHGTRLWRWTGEGEETPLAVYDAVGGVWAPVRADAVQAPRTE